MPKALLSLVAIIPALEAMERWLDRETGRRFNALDLFPINENATSSILAFLLDPRETHGQNDAFLRLFIRRFVPGRHVIANVKVSENGGTIHHPTSMILTPIEIHEDTKPVDSSHWGEFD
jgi:PD-(D/E)XK nuclease superfamily